jgi:glycosyltransferase involved in cell wall biosynthesis
MRVLYSFPHKLGAGRICYTALQQINGLAEAGVEILAAPASLRGNLPSSVTIRPTLARGRVRVPYKILGSMRAFALHDYIVSRRVDELVGQIDIIHVWPLGAQRTLKVAAEFGIPTVLERPNAHTRFAYEVVRKECERIGVALPANHEHAFNADVLRKEEEEYRLADRILCPSEFTMKTFVNYGFPTQQLARHFYGFDEKTFYPIDGGRKNANTFTMLFVGVAAVRKGLHFALEAWLASSAHRHGSFLIAGDVLPEYAAKLAPMLSHPSVHLLGHRNDVPELMRQSDIFVLPTIEEGFGLVCTEAMGSGCVPLVSEACTDICKHMENALVHSIGDVAALTGHITNLYEDRILLNKLRTAGLAKVPDITWSAAGRRLLQIYSETVDAYRIEGRRMANAPKTTNLIDQKASLQWHRGINCV